MIASTAYKVIQRTLEVISDQGVDDLVDMNDVKEYLAECEKRTGVNLGYSREIDPNVYSGQINLAYLNERGIIFLEEKSGRGRYSAKISALGRGFAIIAGLRLNEKIEEAMKEYPFSVHLRRKAMHSAPREVINLDNHRRDQ